MRSLFILFIAMLILPMAGCSKNETKVKPMSENSRMDQVNVSGVTVKDMDGKDISLADRKGKVLLIVNVASKCGYTVQYDGLEAIYKKYKDKGFEVLAFPTNDFGGQEPGTNEEIRTFCESKYNVTFPLFNKVQVLGEGKEPLFTKLDEVEPKGEIDWNFEKFLVDKSGNVTGRFKSKVKPESKELIAAIEAELNK